MLKVVTLGLTALMFSSAASAKITSIEVTSSGFKVEDDASPEKIKIKYSHYLNHEAVNRCLKLAIHAQDEDLKFEAVSNVVLDSGVSYVSGCKVSVPIVDQ